MFGLKSYQEEYDELYEYLTQDWQMKEPYATAFLTAYKKNIGKILAEGKKRIAMLDTSDDPMARLAGIASMGEEHPFALVAQAYQAYMSDLRRGKNVGTPVELAIWAILYNRSDLLEQLDRAFAKFIDEKTDEKFPNLLDTVFS